MASTSVEFILQVLGEKEVQLQLLRKEKERMEKKLTELAIENGKLREEANATKDVHG